MTTGIKARYADLKSQLTTLPPPGRSRELWLQHAIGYLIFNDVRGYAINNIDPSLDESNRRIALKSIDDAVYGLMMVIDGVPGPLRNEDFEVGLQFVARLSRRSDDEIVEQLDLFRGDGMCMGYHFWIDGDFGENMPFVT